MLIRRKWRAALEHIAKIENKRNTVLFLDAFDEDPAAGTDHQSRLHQIMSACDEFSHILITCRTQFFFLDADIPIGPGLPFVGGRDLDTPGKHMFRTLYMLPLTDEQISEYVKKRFTFTEQRKRKGALDRISRVRLLSARPLLLSKIPEVMTGDEQIEYAFELYDLMVKKWLNWEQAWVDKEAMRTFSENLAVDLYANRNERGAEWITGGELVKLLAEYGKALEPFKVRRRSLLNRDAAGNVKFAHRSVMEYLFVKRFLGLHPGNRPRVVWTDLMKLFLVEMLKHRGSALTLGNLGPNALQVQEVDLSGAAITGVNLTNTCFERAHLVNTVFSGSVLSGSSFKNAKLRGANLSNCDLTSVDLSSADLTGANLANAILTGAILDGANASKTRSGLS